MLVDNKEMCHIHKKGCKDELWYPGSIIQTKDNFSSIFVDDLKRIDEILDVEKASILGDARRRSEAYLYKLRQSGLTYFNTEAILTVFERETALERVRRLKFSKMPSRLTAIWLTTEEGIKFWENNLSQSLWYKDIVTYDVKATGDMHHTTDLLIPDDTLSYEEMLEAAEYYWNPSQADLGKKQDEYLFQGKIKVLEKRKRGLFR